MFPLAQKFVERVVLVEDADIRAAQEALWEVLRVAALLTHRYRPAAGERVGILVCGGNTTAVDFSR